MCKHHFPACIPHSRLQHQSIEAEAIGIQQIFQLPAYFVCILRLTCKGKELHNQMNAQRRPQPAYVPACISRFPHMSILSQPWLPLVEVTLLNLAIDTPFKKAKQHRLAIEDQVPVQETFSYKGECCPILLPFQKASSNPLP